MAKHDRRPFLFAGAALVALSQAGAAGAQEADAAAENEEIVVTGSRIPQPNLISTSPVTQIGSEEVSLRGVMRIEDMINTLPQAFGAQGSTIANGATGTANVNLRMLGAVRTLVLVNGRRLSPGDPGLGAAAPDLNAIPAALVDRVEVLTGGASAVYGADAVAGVVNFIMQDDFEGARFDAQYSFYQHTNDGRIGDVVANHAAANPRFFRVPDENVVDGEAVNFTTVFGANSEDGRGNVTAYASYRNVQPILQAERDYSACTLFSNAGGDFTTCQGSSNSFPLVFTALDQATLNLVGNTRIIGDGDLPRDFVGTTDAYNFGAVNHFQRPDERYSIGAMAHYEINPHLELYTDLMFMDDRSQAQIAESAIFAFAGYASNGGAYAINCDNPFIQSNGVSTEICANVGLGPTDTALVDFRYRNVTGAPRIADIRHTMYRAVLGARGELADGWNYDLYGSYGTTLFQLHFLNEVSLRRAQNGLIVDDLDAGPGIDPICRVNNDADPTNDDPGCVPLNLFTQAGLTAAEAASISVDGFQQGQVTEQVFSGSITGDLASLGVKSPWSEDAFEVAMGLEYRRAASDLDTDTNFCPPAPPGIASVPDLLGQGGTICPVSGSYDVFELYGEARLPLVQGAPFFELLSLEGAYRYSDYSTGQTTDTYKVGGDWAPTSDIRFRGSYQRAVRAPNITELFAPQAVGLDGSTDPCAGNLNNADPDDDPTAALAQCEFSGVSPAQYGNIASSPAGQYNGLIGGDPNLIPETADTYTVGFVFTPRFATGLTLSVDWYNIRIEDIIRGIGADFILTGCLQNGDPFLCDLINRAPGTGLLWGGPQGFVRDVNTNTGSIETTGIDIEGNYRIDFADWGMESAGGLAVNFVGTYLQEYINEPVKGLGEYDCVGLYGPICAANADGFGGPLPEWRHKLRLTWDTPLPGLQLSGTWRHFGSVLLEQASSNPLLEGDGVVEESDRKLEAMNYFDIAGAWDAWDNVTFRAGVNNVFDEDPPLTGSLNANSNCPSGPCSGNTWPMLYDALGRYIFFGISADF